MVEKKPSKFETSILINLQKWSGDFSAYLVV